MKLIRERTILVALIVLPAMVSVGCAHLKNGNVKFMRETHEPAMGWHPDKGMSLLIFVRPKDRLYAYQTGVFDIQADDPKLIGLLAAGTRIQYQTQPGRHAFMSAGYGARTEFLNADLLPDKTYYVLIRTWTNGWGVWESIFKPIAPSNTPLSQLQETLEATRSIERSPDSETWLRDHISDLRNRRNRYGEKAYAARRTQQLEANQGW